MIKYLSLEDARDRMMAYEGIEYVYIGLPHRFVSSFGGPTLLQPISNIVPDGECWMVRRPHPIDPSKSISIRVIRDGGIVLAVANTHGHTVVKSVRRMMDRAMRSLKEMSS